MNLHINRFWHCLISCCLSVPKQKISHAEIFEEFHTVFSLRDIALKEQITEELVELSIWREHEHYK